MKLAYIGNGRKSVMRLWRIVDDTGFSGLLFLVVNRQVMVIVWVTASEFFHGVLDSENTWEMAGVGGFVLLEYRKFSCQLDK